MRRSASLGTFGPPSTPNSRVNPARSSDIGGVGGPGRGTSPTRSGIGSRGISTPGGGGSYYRGNSSDGVSAILGGGHPPSSPSVGRPGARPATQGSRPPVGGGIMSPKTGSSVGGGMQRASSSGPGMMRGGLGAGSSIAVDSNLQFDCKVLQSGGKSSAQPLSLVSGSGETQGMRPTMEDAHLALINAGTASDGQPVSLFAVLDGHCGRRAADLGSHFLPETVLSRPSLGVDNARAFAEAVVQTDKAIFNQMGRSDGGSTLIAALIHNKMLFVANLGDARAVLYDGTSTIPMSVDHKPTDMPEQQRIVRCGSFVHFGRVGACLAVSRALGDYEFKFSGTRYSSEKEFAVGHVPDIRQINLTDSSKFLLLACDGLWDVCSNEEATAFVNSFMSSADTRDFEKALSTCSTQLALHAVESGSMDNVTCMIVWFHGPTGSTTTGTGSSNIGGSPSSQHVTGGGPPPSSAGGVGLSNGAGGNSITGKITGDYGSVPPSRGLGARPATQGAPGYGTRSASSGVGSFNRTTPGSTNTRLPSLGGGFGSRRF